jgi:hypothetical protein
MRRGAEPLLQLRPASAARDVADSDGDGLLLPDQHDQLFVSRDAVRAAGGRIIA